MGELEHTNGELAGQIESYSAQQDKINLALAGAIEKARNIEFASKVQYSLEADRLAQFVTKWTEYCNDNMPADLVKQNKELTDYLTHAKAELENMLTEELNLSKSLTQAELDYHSEKERIAE